MKFLLNPIVSCYKDGTAIEKFINWLDDVSSFNNSAIIRGVTGATYLAILVPLLIFLIIILHLELILSRIIFRHRVSIAGGVFYEEQFKNELLPWLKSSYPWYKWNYHEIETGLPIIFKKSIYGFHDIIEIRFLTKDQQTLFELTWRGNITFRQK